MKNLPIILFKHRDKDNLEVEGRGSNYKSKWILNKRALKEHSFSMKSKLTDLYQIFEKRSRYNSKLPVIVRTKIIDDAIAKSYRNKISSLLSVKDSNIIGFYNKNELLIKVRDEIELRQIVEHFEHPDNFEVAISAINDLILHKPIMSFENISENQNIAKVKLFNYCDKFLNFELRNAFDLFCRENEIEFKRIDQYGEGLFIYAIENINQPTLDSLKKFDGIFEISNMPLYKPEKSDPGLNKKIPVKMPDPELEYPTVGILDSGVSNNHYFTPWLIHERKISHYKEEEIDQAHGTSVASILLYGSELQGKTEENGLCKIIDATVFPNLDKRELPEHELIVQIENTIANNKDVKVWNLSLGTNKEIDPYKFSDFGVTLDNLQRKYGILICKSVGNCDNFKKGISNGRISQSGDSVLSIVVGSLAHDKAEFDLAEIDHPSPFTRFGPGPANIIKPDLVEYGGNVGKQGDQYVNNGVTTLAPNGDITKNAGTSFSTPRVTALAASLSHNIDMEFDPLLVKTLLIHSAQHPDSVLSDSETKIKQMGYGLPLRIPQMLYNDQNEITLVLRDKVEKGEFIEIVDFPYPELIENGFYYGKISVTLVSKPILEASQGVEYCQSDLDVKFGTYDFLKKRDMNDPRVKIPYSKINSKNLLLSSAFSKRKIKSIDNRFKKERVLLDKHKKYQPVKKWVINIDELRNSVLESHLKVPKSWYLKIRPYFRDFTESKFVNDATSVDLEFCLVVTISDPLEKGIVNKSVRNASQEQGFGSHSIPLKSSKTMKKSKVKTRVPDL